MTLVAPIDLKQWYQTVNEALGFSTATAAPEPVHVLTGFLNRQVRFDSRPAPLATALVARVAGGSRWVKDDPSGLRAEALEAGLILPESDEQLEVLRRTLRLVVASDLAVFPTYQSYQVAHLGMVTSDRTGAGIGGFGASLVMAAEGGSSATQALVDRLMEPQANPVWALEAAAVGRNFTLTLAGPADLPPWTSSPGASQLATDLGQLLIRTTQLASESVDTLEGLRTLALASTWASVLAFTQVPSLMQGQGMQLIPLSVAAADDCPALRDASHQALNSVAQSFRRWLRQMLAQRVVDDFAGEPSENDAREWLLSAKPFKESLAAQKTKGGLARVFDDALMGNSVSVAAAQALLTFLEATMNSSAIDTYSSLGRACGFVFPRRSNARRRFCVEFPLVPALVLAGFDEAEERLSFDDWAERIRSRFGLLIAEPSSENLELRPRPSDSEWSRNRSATIELLQRVGLAETFSDQVAEVLNPLVLWRRVSS